jgi:hypothetical protein
VDSDTFIVGPLGELNGLIHFKILAQCLKHNKSQCTVVIVTVIVVVITTSGESVSNEVFIK